jgi:hypothetical protein
MGTNSGAARFGSIQKIEFLALGISTRELRKWCTEKLEGV